MSDEDRKRRVEEARKQRAEADLELKRLEDEQRLEEAREEKKRKAQAEEARMAEQRRIDERTQKEWEQRRTSLTRSPPPSGSAVRPALGVGSSMSSLTGTDDESSKKRQRVSPTGQHRHQLKKTRKDDADEDVEDVGDSAEDALTTILEMTKKIDRWAFNQQTKMKGLSKTQVANLGELVATIEACVAKAKEDRARLEGRLAERGDILNVLREATVRTAPPTAGTVTGDCYMDDHEGFQFPPLGRFSSAVKKRRIPKVTGVDKAALGRPNQVLMTMDGKDAEDTRKEIKRRINPSTVGVNVRKIFNTKKGVVMEVDRPDEVDKLLDSQILSWDQGGEAQAEEYNNDDL